MGALTEAEAVTLARVENRGPWSDECIAGLCVMVRRLEARTEWAETSLRTILKQSTENIDRAYVLFRLEAIADEAREGLAPPEYGAPTAPREAAKEAEHKAFCNNPDCLTGLVEVDDLGALCPGCGVPLFAAFRCATPTESTGAKCLHRNPPVGYDGKLWCQDCGVCISGTTPTSEESK